MKLRGRNGEYIYNYRFSFNGKESDGEVSGEGNTVDYGARIYDSRIGRWFSCDPLQKKYTSQSPFSFVANSPLFFVDKDGKENIVYLVNVPDEKGALTLSNAKLAEVAANLNAYSAQNHLNVKYVVYDPTINGDFNKKNLDKSDGVQLVGNPENVKKFNEVHNLTDDKAMKSWTGGTENPEKTDDKNDVGYIDGNYLKTNSYTTWYTKFLVLHSTGHMANNYEVGVDDHLDTYKKPGVPDEPNIMNSGTHASKYSQNSRWMGKIKNWGDYLVRAFRKENNSILFQRIRARFKGETKDNYATNRKKNENEKKKK